LLCRLARDRKVEDRTGSQGSQQTVALEGEEKDDLVVVVVVVVDYSDSSTDSTF